MPKTESRYCKERENAIKRFMPSEKQKGYALGVTTKKRQKAFSVQNAMSKSENGRLKEQKKESVKTAVISGIFGKKKGFVRCAANQRFQGKSFVKSIMKLPLKTQSMPESIQSGGRRITNFCL